MPSMLRLWFRFPALFKKKKGGVERKGGKEKDRREARQEEAMEELEIWFSG